MTGFSLVGSLRFVGLPEMLQGRGVREFGLKPQNVARKHFLPGPTFSILSNRRVCTLKPALTMCF